MRLFNVPSVSLGYKVVTLGCCVDAPTFLSEVSLVFMGYIFVTRKRVIEYVRGCVGVLFVHELHFCNPK